MRNPHIIWASVSIVFMLVAGAVVLSIFDKDVATIITLAGIVAVPVLSAFGVAVYQKLDHVKEISNSHQSELLDMMKMLQAQATNLALQSKPGDMFTAREVDALLSEKPHDNAP